MFGAVGQGKARLGNLKTLRFCWNNGFLSVFMKHAVSRLSLSNVSVKLLDDSKCTIVSIEGCRIIMDEKFQEILFDEPICLKPTWYAVILHIESSGHTYAGNKGEKLINIDDELFIEFRDSPLSTSPTNVERGQIP
ncbi:hypothetical protein ACJMK2_009052, partial [Sinanodonta woodiana]